MLLNPLLLLLTIGLFVLLLILFTNQNARNNLQKNISMMVTLHNVLMYHQQIANVPLGFSNQGQEQQKQSDDFRHFAIRWLSMHTNLIDNGSPLCEHPIKENSWTHFAAEQNCFTKIASQPMMINIPLTLCINHPVIMDYNNWSRCVVTNTHYAMAGLISLRLNLSSIVTADPSAANRIVVINIDPSTKRWQWVIE